MTIHRNQHSSAECHPSPSSEPQQKIYEPHPAPTHLRHDVRLAVVPIAMELQAPCQFQAPNSRLIATELKFLDPASYPPVQPDTTQSYSFLTNPALPQHPVTSGTYGLASTARALLKWRIKNPNAGPVRQVSSQSTFDIQEQTRHQGGLEFKKRIKKEEAAMRAGRTQLWERR